MTSFNLRPARPEDAAAIATVHIAARREAMPWLPELHDEQDTRDWLAHVVLPRQVVWVAEVDGEVVGVAALDGASLEQLYVLPGHQGQGIGGALLARAQGRAGDRLSLWTFQRNAAARAFYERHGFVAVEFGDGSGNEEGEPDVRYEWRSAG